MFYNRNKKLLYTVPWNIFQKRYKNYKFGSQISQVNVVKVYQETECNKWEEERKWKGSNKEGNKGWKKDSG